MYHQRADALVLTFGQNSAPAFHPASGIRHRVQTNPRPAREAASTTEHATLSTWINLLRITTFTYRYVSFKI
jgi:hypothetical protein